MVTEAVIQVTVGTQTITLLSVDHQLNPSSPSDTKPTASTGFTVISTPIEVDGLKLWFEYKTVEASP